MDEAGLWLARLDSGTADPVDFEKWRSGDPRRASAFVQVANAAQALDRAKPALKRAPRSRGVNRRYFMTAAVGILSLAAGTGVFLYKGRARASTLIGQRRRFTLPNGATLDLNTDSAAEWRAGEKRLGVWLTKGELALTVRTPDQACLLYASDSTVDINLGHVNARLRGHMMDLTVLDGQATVRTGAGIVTGSSKKVVVRPEQAVLAGSDTQLVRDLSAPDVQFVATWPEGELAFEDQTLDTAIGEYNRYLSKKIIIADPSLASVQVGGRFSSSDPSVFLAALKSSLGIKVTVDSDGTAVLTK
jgi:transmembrane sensor